MIAYDKLPRRSLQLRAMLSRVCTMLRPRDPSAWYDVGLAYKYLHDWRRSAKANERAIDLYPERDYAAWWNLGIAATALRDWTLARRAWRGYGLDLPDGFGPIEANWSETPVRLPNGETVWAKRIDPARALIRSIPFPESGFRWHDIVLHDGAAKGERELRGKRYPVFDVLERWEASAMPTTCVDVICKSDDDARLLVEAFESLELAAEDWTTTVRPLCQACSEGLPDEFHVHDRLEVKPDRREFGVAAPVDCIEAVVPAWVAESPDTREFIAMHADALQGSQHTLKGTEP